MITLAHAEPPSILLIAAMELRAASTKVVEDRNGVDILGELQIDVLVSRGIVEQVPVVRCLLNRRRAQGVPDLVLLLHRCESIEEVCEHRCLAVGSWPRDGVEDEGSGKGADCDIEGSLEKQPVNI